MSLRGLITGIRAAAAAAAAFVFGMILTGGACATAAPGGSESGDCGLSAGCSDSMLGFLPSGIARVVTGDLLVGVNGDAGGVS